MEGLIPERKALDELCANFPDLVQNRFNIDIEATRRARQDAADLKAYHQRRLDSLQEQVLFVAQEEAKAKEGQIAAQRGESTARERLGVIQKEMDLERKALENAEQKLQRMVEIVEIDGKVKASAGGGAAGFVTGAGVAYGSTASQVLGFAVTRAGAVLMGGVGAAATGVGFLCYGTYRYGVRRGERKNQEALLQSLRETQQEKQLFLDSKEADAQLVRKKEEEEGQALLKAKQMQDKLQVQKDELLEEMERVKKGLEEAENSWKESEALLHQSHIELENAKTELEEHNDLEKYQDSKDKVENRILDDLASDKYGAIADASRTSKKSIALLGARGAGKSTLINSLVGQQVTDTGGVDTTLQYSKVCEFANVEVWDSPGDTPERSLVNLKVFATMKKMHMVLVLYQQDVVQTFLIVRACKQLGVPCCVVRNMFAPLPEDCKCTHSSKKCHRCILASDVAKLNAKGLNTTVGGQETSVPVVFLSALSPNGVGMSLLRSQLQMNSIIISGALLDMVGAMCSHALIDAAWICKMQSHFLQDDVKGAAEVLQLFRDSDLMNPSELDALERITAEKTAEWKLMGLTDDDICRRMPIYWYSLEAPNIYEPVSKILNNTETRVSDTNVVPDAMRFIKWLVDGALDLGEEYEHFGMAWRGVCYRYEGDDWDKFKCGNIFAWYTVKSVTADSAALEQLFDDVDKPLTIFIIEDCKGMRIESLSNFTLEREVLILPGAVFKAKSCERGSAGADNLWARADKITLQMQGNVLISPEDFRLGKALHVAEAA